MDEQSEKTRIRLADHLAQHTYDYLQVPPNGNRNIVIIGDLNDEPFSRSLDFLNTHRHHGRAQGPRHWTDDDAKRVHLYNATWRLLGEQFGHVGPSGLAGGINGAAGTYYWEAKRSWANLDHIIVSGGLLRPSRPYLNEEKTMIISLPEFLTNGFPKKFSEDSGKFSGVSDHLPLFGAIEL